MALFQVKYFDENIRILLTSILYPHGNFFARFVFAGKKNEYVELLLFDGKDGPCNVIKTKDSRNNVYIFLNCLTQSLSNYFECYHQPGVGGEYYVHPSELGIGCSDNHEMYMYVEKLTTNAITSII